jgi:hypothetical protein
MTGFNIYNSTGDYLGYSPSDDPLAAALRFLARKGVDMWAIDMFEEGDGSITANFDGVTVSLRRPARDQSVA